MNAVRGREVALNSFSLVWLLPATPVIGLLINHINCVSTHDDKRMSMLSCNKGFNLKGPNSRQMI